MLSSFTSIYNTLVLRQPLATLIALAVVIVYFLLYIPQFELDASADGPIVVYCKSGRRAGMAISVLQDEGFDDLIHLDGDMQAWAAMQQASGAGSGAESRAGSRAE